MDPCYGFFSPSNLFGAEAHSEDLYNITDNICRFGSGGLVFLLMLYPSYFRAFNRFKGMIQSGYQHYGPQMKAAPTDIFFERTVLYPLSMPPSSSSTPSEESHFMHLSYATAHDQYVGRGLPVIDDFHQGFMDDGYAHCSQPSFGQQRPTIAGGDFLTNLEQDTIAYWKQYSIVADQHILSTGSDVMMDIVPMVHTPNSGPLVFRCQHHTGNRPCGMSVDGDIQHALDHFSRFHVQSMFTTSESPWICRWGGECDSRLHKGSWKRHVVAHLARWKCSNCSQTYSRDDSARKHAKHCGGNGHILMVPRLDDRPA